MRGVHFLPPHCIQGIPGSSPHARGPLIDNNSIDLVLRIIPACAGST